MMHPRKVTPQTEHRLREMQRVNDSPSLREKFPKLKSLRIDLAYFEMDGLTRRSGLRYKANIRHAKSVFSFVCPNAECVGGDFDLSKAVAEAATAKRKTVEGEIRCHGWRDKPNQGKVPCHNLLRYKLILGYV